MGQAVTVTSTSKDGEDVTITIEATGNDTGRITAVRSEGEGHPKTDVIELSHVRQLHRPGAISCRARSSGLDLEVRCTLNAPARGHVPSVSIVAKAFILKLLDETYPLEQPEYEDIRAFLADAKFPAE